MHQLFKKSLRGLAARFSAVALGLGITAGQGLFAAPSLDISDFVQKIKISGDFRLRQENFDFRPPNAARDRSRQRFRLRLGADFSFPGNVAAKMRFASGTGEQVSTNQSFDNLSGQKQFWIDRAYLEWKPAESFAVSGGRMVFPLWTVYSSDIIWDGDFNPEGFGQQWKGSLLGRGRLFANAMQMAADEDSGTNRDQWEFSEQVGIEVPAFSDHVLKVAGAVHEWVNETSVTRPLAALSPGTLSQTVTNSGNRRLASGNLANEFRIVEITGQYSLSIFNLPVSLQGTYVLNTASLDMYDPKLNKGYQWGTVVGQAKPKSLEIGYFYKYVQTDAVVADVSDSDFGSGGTNRKGHIGWVSTGLTENTTLSFKVFNTKQLDTVSTAGGVAADTSVGGINRFQLDAVVKF